MLNSRFNESLKLNDYTVTCRIEGLRYYATLVVNRYLQYFHGYGHHSGILALHGNQQLEGLCFHCCWQC
jgi:hypothetical protein